MKKWTKFQTKAQKCSKVHFIREIWCSNREIGRFDEKLGDSLENRESWQVCILTILLDFTRAKHRRSGKVRQVLPLTPRPNLNGRQNF